MKISDVRALGIACPPEFDDEEFAWTFLETDCPIWFLRGFPNYPSFGMEARQLGGQRYLVLETPCFMEGLEEVFMGEIIVAHRIGPDALCLDEIEQPLRMAHYSCTNFSRGSAAHDLVTGLGGEWESSLNGYMFFVHVPLLAVPVFENDIRMEFERLS